MRRIKKDALGYISLKMLYTQPFTTAAAEAASRELSHLAVDKMSTFGAIVVTCVVISVLRSTAFALPPFEIRSAPNADFMESSEQWSSKPKRIYGR